ncbi:hypothetical protein [Flavobacterium algicola]|uniref:hypothetical protein n=1 Tax=Flavobacterium algicola TaxID=556529 RepID=UPI001EFD67DE|nr:hypothetical protein [Flavobacterium algicola]MCG9790875.1 hypothetical protein [Flavobacterium algicola]
MKIAIEIIIASIVATSTMTLFSYMISVLTGKLFKEPVLLQFIFLVFGLQFTPKIKVIASWLLHYAIGLFFVLGYYLPVWLEWDWYNITLTSGLIFGVIIGTVGMLGWKIMFTLSKEKPPTDLEGYYLQLFIAHVIFGISTFLVHAILT